MFITGRRYNDANECYDVYSLNLSKVEGIEYEEHETKFIFSTWNISLELPMEEVLEVLRKEQK